MDFNSALDTRAGDIEKPPVLPQGNYIWTVSKLPTISESNSGEWSIIEFPLKPVSAEDDVDPDDLAEFGDLSGAFGRISFMAPTDPDKEADVKKALYRVKQFCLNVLRVDVDDPEAATLKELLDAAHNCQFYAVNSWRTAESGDIFTDQKSPAPLD
jgi:hypothetical protein